ncbi:glycosyltransferase family 2 protein [Escherichia coli]|nr:glycosyltransferase family 2 protein [Escherichia coli]EJN9838369.1 glycosyltransferase family 2 protein [Escherichia coli]MCN5639879.1 glycosyltransferase family 2 protein [Escherichia coli]
MKKVSVLIASYNCAQFIGDTLHSLCSQTMNKDDYEIIIVDDGSTDDSVNIINSLIKEQKNVIFRSRTTNLGVIKTRNELLLLAKGRSEYIAWCDSDDIYNKDKLLRQYTYIKKKKLIGCGTWYKKFGLHDKRIIKFLNPEANRFFLLFGTPVGFPTFMHKNNLDVFFDETLSSSEDYDYLSKICQLGDIGNIPKFYTYYRTHLKQESLGNHSRQRIMHVHLSQKIYNAYFADKIDEQNWIDFPSVLDLRDVKQIIELQNKYFTLFGEVFCAIVDYRFILLNKNKPRCLMYYFLKRNFKLLHIFRLFRGKNVDVSVFNNSR